MSLLLADTLLGFLSGVSMGYCLPFMGVNTTPMRVSVVTASSSICCLSLNFLRLFLCVDGLRLNGNVIGVISGPGSVNVGDLSCNGSYISGVLSNTFLLPFNVSLDLLNFFLSSFLLIFLSRTSSLFSPSKSVLQI